MGDAGVRRRAGVDGESNASEMSCSKSRMEKGCARWALCDGLSRACMSGEGGSGDDEEDMAVGEQKTNINKRQETGEEWTRTPEKDRANQREARLGGAHRSNALRSAVSPSPLHVTQRVHRAHAITVTIV